MHLALLARQRVVATTGEASSVAPRVTSRLLTQRSHAASRSLLDARGSGVEAKAVVIANPAAGLDLPKQNLAPAVLEGTPKPGEFPIPPERLIELAKAVFESDNGIQNPSLLADNFRFEFPIVSLSKQEYLTAVPTFKLKDAFPDMTTNPYHWRVDPYEPNRVWYTVRNVATHSGDLTFFNGTIKATNKVVYGAPECMSYVFDAEGKCTSYTGGYIQDRRVGNTQGLGAMFGVIAAIGGPVLKPGTLEYTLFTGLNDFRGAVSAVVSGIFKTA